MSDNEIPVAAMLEVLADRMESGDLDPVEIPPDSPLGTFLMSVMQEVLGDQRVPARGTPEYRDHLTTLSITNDMQETVAQLGYLWANYGWKAMVDLLVVLVDQIVFFAEPLRDSFGRVPFDKLVRVDPDEATLLESTVQLLNDKEANSHGMDFTTALEQATTLVQNNKPWAVVVQRALDAHQAGRKEDAWPILATGPGLRGENAHRDRVFQAVMMVHLAAYSLRNPSDVARFVLATRNPTGATRRSLQQLARGLPRR